jgi:hypothetical protein
MSMMADCRFFERFNLPLRCLISTSFSSLFYDPCSFGFAQIHWNFTKLEVIFLSLYPALGFQAAFLTLLVSSIVALQYPPLYYSVSHPRDAHFSRHRRCCQRFPSFRDDFSILTTFSCVSLPTHISTKYHQFSLCWSLLKPTFILLIPADDQT